MNKVCNLTALYIYFIFLFSHYNHINFAKCDDISAILDPYEMSRRHTPVKQASYAWF